MGTVLFVGLVHLADIHVLLSNHQAFRKNDFTLLFSCEHRILSQTHTHTLGGVCVCVISKCKCARVSICIFLAANESE